MTDHTIRSGRAFANAWTLRIAPNWMKLAALAAIATLAASSPAVGEIVMTALSDAFLQVSVFVAGTLWLVYGIERRFDADLGEAMARRKRWQPAIAALLGAMPGCGGAIVVVTQFVRGYASFGALISVLVATMGDAAFLLIAREPATAALVIAICAVAGTVTGMVVDAIHGRDFLAAGRASATSLEPPPSPRPAASLRRLWMLLVVPGILLGALLAFRADENAWFGWLGGAEFVTLFGAAGAVLSLVMWATAPEGNSQIGGARHLPMTDRVILDTNFVTAWVVMAFLAYELAVYALGIDIGVLFKTWAPVMPVVAMLVGFIPGCGPQIVVTSLYLAGAIPLSAQLTNAIANDGDALFPAIALAPRAAVMATAYSAVPALLIGYSWYFLFE